MRRLFLFGGWALFFVACSPTPPPTPDLLLSEELPFAESIEPTTRIEFGQRQSQAFLLRGFSSPEGHGVRAFRWTEGEESVLQFFHQGGAPAEVTLVVRAKASEKKAPQLAVIELNHCELGEFEIPKKADRLRLSLPETCLLKGRNELRWRWSWTESPSPKDRRRLAAAFYRLEIESKVSGAVRAHGLDLFFPAGSSVGFFFDPSPGTQLVLSRLEGPGELNLDLISDSGAIVTHGPWTEGDLPIIPLEAGALLELRLETKGSPGTELRLIQPGLALGEVPENPTASSWPQLNSPPNILIYLIDTLRADHLGAYGNPQGLSPHLDAFASEALLFEQPMAQSSWTKSSVASLFTGLLPPFHQANRREERLPSQLETLAESLAQEGYATRAFGTNINISEVFGFTRGFEDFTFMDDETKGSEHLTNGALQWLDQRDPNRPFFLYLHTLDPHSPYQPKEPFRSAFAATVREETFAQSRTHIRQLEHGKQPADPLIVEELKSLYQAEIAANDASFGALLQGLRERGLYEDTVILFLSDHGEEFAENRQWTHGKNLLQETTHIPLILRVPGMAPGRSQVPVQHTDWKPILLQLAGADPSTPVFNLSDSNRPVFSYLHLDGPKKLAVTHQGYKYLSKIRYGTLGAGALYQLEQDPQEEVNLASRFPVRTGYLRTLLRRHLIVPAQGLKAESIEIEGDVKAELKALGYL